MRQAHAKSAQTNSHGPHRPLEQQALCSPTRAGLAQRLSCSWVPSSTQACSPCAKGRRRPTLSSGWIAPGQHPPGAGRAAGAAACRGQGRIASVLRCGREGCRRARVRTSTLSGFMSRWSTPRACACRSADTIWTATLCRKARDEKPAQYAAKRLPVASSIAKPVNAPASSCAVASTCTAARAELSGRRPGLPPRPLSRRPCKLENFP